MRRSVDRFCRSCGYEFPRDDTGDDCRMCVRFEQLRTEAATLRRRDKPRKASAEDPLEVTNLFHSVGRPATPSEYGVVFAAYRARAASAAKSRRGSPAEDVNPAPTPADATTEASTEAVAESAALADKPRSRRRKRPAREEPVVAKAESSALTDKPRSRRRKRSVKEPAAAGGQSPAILEEQSAARHHPPTPRHQPSGWQGPILIRLRTPVQPVNGTVAPPSTALAGESQVPQATPPPGHESRPTPPPTRESAPGWFPAANQTSAAAAERTVLASPDADRVGPRTVRHDAHVGTRWAVSQTALWVVVFSAVIGALVPLLLTR